MGISPDALRQFEQQLLQQADVLALGLAGLKSNDAERAAQLVREITHRLEDAVRAGAPDGPAEALSGAERSRPFIVAPRPGGDEIEEFIVEMLADSPRGLSVQEIVDRLDEAQLAIRRQTLVVRLHRMERAGKLASLAHGHYALSEAERVRRRS